MESCPKCHRHLEDPSAAECLFCGVVFARLRPNRLDDPPPLGHEPKTPPLPEARGKFPPNDVSVFADAEAIARLYRRLVLLVGCQLLLGVFRAPNGTAPSAGETLFSLLFLLALISLLGAIAVTAYKLTHHLGSGAPILWAIAMFLPCLNVLGLLLLSSRAQAWCRAYGIKVGFLGPTAKSIEDIRRRGVLSSTFD